MPAIRIYRKYITCIHVYLIEDFERTERLNKAIVGINNKFGEYIVKPASLLVLRRLDAQPVNIIKRGITRPLSQLDLQDL